MLIDSYSSYALSVLGRSKRTVTDTARRFTLSPAGSHPILTRPSHCRSL